MSQKLKKKEKNPSQRASIGGGKKKVVDIKSKIPAKPSVNDSIKNMTFLSPELQKTLNAIMIDDGMNIKSPLQKYQSNNSRKSSGRKGYAGKFTPTSPRSQDSRKSLNSPRNDMKSSSFSKSNKKAKPARSAYSSKERVSIKQRISASRDNSANMRVSNPRRSLQKSNLQAYDSSAANPFISNSKNNQGQQEEEDEEEYETDPLKGPLASDKNNVFSYVKIENMQSLRHKPAPQPKNFKQAKQAVKQCRDEDKLRAQHGPKYAQPKVTTWKGQHAGSVSEIVKLGSSIRYNQDMSVSLSNQLDPKALTALGAMNTLFGRKSSQKKQSQSLYMQNNQNSNYLNISGGVMDSHTPSWREQQGVTVNFNNVSTQQEESPPHRSHSVSNVHNSQSKDQPNKLQQSIDGSLKKQNQNSNSLISSFQRKPFPGGGGGAYPRLSKSGSVGQIGGRGNNSTNVSNIINSSTLPPGVGNVITASVKKYNKKNARALMNLFNSILSMLDPNFDETEVYRTIRILKQLCESRHVSQDQLQEIQQQFQAINPPPQNDKKHFEIYQFVSCVIGHFHQKLYQYNNSVYSMGGGTSNEQEEQDESQSSKRAAQRYQYQVDNNYSNRDGYLSDFTPRNTEYDLQVMQAMAGRVQPPSNQIQETIAKKYNIPTLALPLSSKSGAVVANPKFVQKQEVEQFGGDEEENKYHTESNDLQIIKYNSIPLTRSPSAKARLVNDKQDSVFSPSAAIVMNNNISGNKYQHQINSPEKQKKKQNINKAINIVMKENIKSLKKFFNRIDRLTQESVSRGIQQQQDQSKSFTIAQDAHNNKYQSNDVARTPAKHASTSSNRKYKSAIKSSAMLMNSSNSKGAYDDKRLKSLSKKNKKTNSFGGAMNSNNNNNSISFNTSSFLSPGNSNAPISSLGGAIGSNSSFLKSGKSQQQQQQNQSHFSIRQQQQQQQQHTNNNLKVQHSAIYPEQSRLNVSAAATIARHIASINEAKKVPKKDPHHGPDALIKNEVVLYPFAQTRDRKKQLVVKVKERPSSPTKRLINLKNARVEASKHLNRLGSAHTYNLCVMSKDREEEDEERELFQHQSKSRYEQIVKQAAQTFTSPSQHSRQRMIGDESSDSDLERANPADQLHYQADQDVPPEPQKRAPSATKPEPKKQLQHHSFKNSTPKAKNPIQNHSKATPFEYSNSKATGSTPSSQKNPISSASGKNIYSASSSSYLQSSSPKQNQMEVAYVSFGDSQQVKSSASTKKGIEFDSNFGSQNQKVNYKKKPIKKGARNHSGSMTKSKTLMNTSQPFTLAKEFSKQMKETIVIEQKRGASPGPATMVKNSRKMFGDTIKSKNYLSNSLQRDKERLERSCRFLISKLAGKRDTSLNKSAN